LEIEPNFFFCIYIGAHLRFFSLLYKIMGLKCSCDTVDCNSKDKDSDMDHNQISKFYGPGWYYLTSNIVIRKDLDVSSGIICTLDKGTRVHLKEIQEWSVLIDNPVVGYIPLLDAHTGRCSIVLNELKRRKLGKRTIFVT